MAGTVVTSRANSAREDANARFQELQSQDALERGRAEEEASRRRTAALLGSQRSQLAANGVELDSGSASDLLADTVGLGELDALTIRNNAEREAFGFASAAEISRTSADNTRSSGLVNAGGSLLTGAAQVSSKFDAFRRGR